MTTISDETLMAYLDNELPADERARVNEALAKDVALQARLKRQERVREMLSAAFDPAARQGVPEQLVAAALHTPASWRWRVREALSRFFGGGARELVPRFGLAAATLVLGLAIGWLAASRGGGGFAGGEVIAGGELARTLDQQLASDDTRAGARVGVSFRARDGRLCRTFDRGAARDNSAGVACRDEGGWTIVALAPAAPRTGGYELAGAGMPDLVRSTVASLIAGEPLDREAERRARDAGWR